MPDLFQKYREDRNPEVIYQLCEHILQEDREQAVKMMISLLPCDSHELGDRLVIELAELATEADVIALRDRDVADGGGTVFGQIAENAERRIRERT